MTLGSLFAGIGGFDLGFSARFKTVWACELDKNCRALLAEKWPKAELHDDINTFDPDAFPCPDVITFGSPCQDLSVAGLRSGLKGNRSGLFYEAARIIQRYAARGLRFAIWENVPGAFSSNGGRDFGLVLRGMAQCGAVDIAWRVLDAQWFGVAQRRRRVFLVADFRGERAGQVLSLTESLQGHPAPSRETGEGVASAIRAGAAGGGYDQKGDKCGLIPETANPLTARMAKGINSTLDEGQTPIAFHTRQDPITTVNYTPPLDNSQPQGVAVTVKAFTASEQSNGFAWESDVYPTLHAQIPNDTSNLQQGIRTANTVRRLTPRECERLQGFPDDWTAGFSDSARYRMLGNAVAVPVAEWIARNIPE